MSVSFRIDRIIGDRLFAEVGDPVLVVEDERQRVLAVAGACDFSTRTAPVGVYGADDLTCRGLLRARFPVHAMAFHPGLPLLAVGSGSYDGGFAFRGQLLLLDLETGAATSLLKSYSSFESYSGRQVLGLEWLDDHRLRVRMAPPHDHKDDSALVEGYVAVIHRPDWRSVPANSLTEDDLDGPRIPLPRPDGRDRARRRICELAPKWQPRRNISALEELSDGRIIAALDGVGLEAWSPSGDLLWTVPDHLGGRDIVVAADERSAWIALIRRGWRNEPQSVVRLSLEDGAQLDQLSPPAPGSLVRCADGVPAFAPEGSNYEHSRLRIRRGTRIYFYDILRNEGALGSGGRETWLATADFEPSQVVHPPRAPKLADFTRVFPFSWAPGETHSAGPGVETSDGDLVHAGTVYNSRGLQPGGSFVVRRSATTGEPTWILRADREATSLDADDESVYIAYDDGELVALELRSGAVLWRRHLAVAKIPVIPTALTVVGPGRLLIGSDDGRILRCSIG
ncbi:PQQ-binding-like beta-propeller repeat protein [Nocardia sp. NPDC050712]|uniref:outer membrane protein assembly factor BamB family protein n=1 Tax=Nocardia sp. NPDC050712 TaxID=3155518 RepID=UPI0033FEE9A7